MDNKIEIVSLEEKPDYAPLCAHWSYTQWYRERDIPFDLNLKAYQQRTIGTTIPTAYVATIDTLPVGMGSLKENDLWSRRDLNPWLASLYVMPEFRGMGIAGRLIDAIITKARDLGFEKIFLFLGHNEEMDLARFYEMRGWRFHESTIDNDGKETDIYFYGLNKSDR
ncbi:MAG: hypothetical protein CVV44_00475 [Spirochaetae bacterium HGW-Spirochaetae-1]|jgi:GNAT superfamily N-acetyltransferase|nr:MAG: hypothetical protein CVV44_00475 [Spirochaetae bacterium HGW-Spirochaetae-1]